MAHVEPVYETVPGWKEDISGCRTYSELPRATRDYIERIEAAQRLGVWLFFTGMRHFRH